MVAAMVTATRAIWFSRALMGMVGCLALSGCKPCKLDNSDMWRPGDHGDYNCLGDCKSGSCKLQVQVNGTWTNLGVKRKSRDEVDEMAGKPIPEQPPTTAPTWVRCSCY